MLSLKHPWHILWQFDYIFVELATFLQYVYFLIISIVVSIILSTIYRSSNCSITSISLIISTILMILINNAHPPPPPAANTSCSPRARSKTQGCQRPSCDRRRRMATLAALLTPRTTRRMKPPPLLTLMLTLHAFPAALEGGIASASPRDMPVSVLDADFSSRVVFHAFFMPI